MTNKGIKHFLRCGMTYFLKFKGKKAFSFLQNYKILDLSKFEAIADNNLKKCDRKTEIYFWNDRKHCRKKGENAVY